MEIIQPTSGSGDKKIETATDVELKTVTGTGGAPQEAPAQPATEEGGDLIRNSLQGKEDWKEVDFKLDEKTTELFNLEHNSPQDKEGIKKLRREINALKDEKFTKPRGGRGTKAGPELGEALRDVVSAAPAENAGGQDEDAQLVESLKEGTGFVRGGKEAQEAIDAFMKQHEGVPSEATQQTTNEKVHTETGAGTPPATPNEQTVNAAREIFQQKATDEEETSAAATTTEKPTPQSTYAKALDDRWAEIEAARKAAGQPIGEGLELEPLTPTPEIQHEPLAIPEGMPGPHLVTANEASKIKETPAAIEGEFIGAPEKEQGPTTFEGAFTRVAEKKEKTPEELKQEKLERIRAKLDRMTGMNKEVESRAEKIGALDAVRKVGEIWNKVPKRYKYTAALAMFAAGGGAWVAGYAIGSRFLSGAGLFTTFDTILKGRLEKKTGAPRSNEATARHALYAGVGAIIIAGFSGKIAGELMGHFFPPEAASHTMTGGAIAAAHTAPTIPHEKLTELATIKEGQGFWQPIHNQLAALHPDWTAEHLNHETQELLVKNSIINADGSELQISNVGTHVILNPDNTITYDHNAVYTAVSEPGAAEAATPHVPATPGAHEVTATMPQEIAPTDPSILSAADDIVHNYVNEHFGTKGFLGFGAQDGFDSIHWKDHEVGFANQPVEKVLAAHPSAFPDDGARHFGIEDYGATQKMQAGLAQVAHETGIIARPNETVSDYLKRAAVTGLSGQGAGEAVKTPTILHT